MAQGKELSIAVVDDLESDREQARRQIQDILGSSNIAHSISSYGNGWELLEDMRRGSRFNLLVFDVMMDDMDGMTLAEEIRRGGNDTSIIFISSNREMAMRGYEVSAARYLAKPIDREKLKEALLYCHEMWRAKKEILLPTSQGQYRTSFSDIQFVEAIDRGTKFVLSGETVETRLKFSEAEALLPKSVFIHCHRSYIVNVAMTKRICPNEFIMKSGLSVPISRPRYSEVNRQFVEYFNN